MKIGIGFDSHKLRKGRKLILGGIEIKSNMGLEGVSDADVLIHALCDALLGAIGEKDLGELFPDKDPKNRNRKSKEFLSLVKKKLNKNKFKILNIDTVLILKTPIIIGYKSKIRENLTKLLKISKSQISLKAKRPEGFPLAGKNCISCIAVALLL
jgi:2-C-methyl-D-erythritol 2,4-cyclodiphosphate synthase